MDICEWNYMMHFDRDLIFEFWIMKFVLEERKTAEHSFLSVWLLKFASKAK